MKRLPRTLILAMVLLLSGCRVELYKMLPEDDANQMLALLLLHHIDAEKLSEKEGLSLWVEQTQFTHAVELLRLNGFPRRQYTSVESMFPANQLVVSPLEEQQKMVFLKEQRLESMLSHIEGVVGADVTIASRAPNDDGSSVPASVAVFLKYSPQVNLETFRVQIKNLVEKAIPGVQYEQISILMQPVEFQMPPVISVKEPLRMDLDQVEAWGLAHRKPLLLAAGAFLLSILLLLSAWLVGRRR